MMRQLSEPDFSSFVLGETDEDITVASSREVRSAAATMAAGATRTIDITSRDMDAAVYDQAVFVEEVQRMLLGSRRARLRVLVQDPARVIALGHRLLELARRMPSFAEIRVMARAHQHDNSAWMVADGTGVIHRELADRYEGVVNFRSPRRADELLRQFEPAWSNAREDTNLRSIRI